MPEDMVIEQADDSDTTQVETPTSAIAGTVAKIVLKRSGAETDVSFEVHPPATIGRFDPGVGPVDIDLGDLPEAGYISRKHAKITLDDAVWTIHDLGSSNGTFLLTGEGATADFVRQEASNLADGAEFALGNARFVFYLARDSGDAEPEIVEVPEAPAHEESVATE